MQARISFATPDLFLMDGVQISRHPPDVTIPATVVGKIVGLQVGRRARQR